MIEHEHGEARDESLAAAGPVASMPPLARGGDRPRTILSVAYPLAPVGPDAAGGAEQVLAHVDRALVEAGHRSIVVACEGSESAGMLLATERPEGILESHHHAALQRRHRAAIEEACVRYGVDVVHLHGLDFHTYLPAGNVPVLVTLHLPLAWYEAEALRPERPNTFLHCVSAHQRSTAPTGVPLLPEIENGVPVERLRVRHARRSFVVSLGRICWEKGFHLALDAAREAGVSMLLAGKVYDYAAHHRYFERAIVPRLDAQRRFIGPVGFDRKRRLLTAARALLVPSQAPETSSLVAMEALACGTPVIAFDTGALPEVIEEGRTGFIVRDVHEMAQAIGRAGELDPEACRRAAVERFSVERMTRSYLELYARLAGIDPAGHPAPSAASRGASLSRG